MAMRGNRSSLQFILLGAAVVVAAVALLLYLPKPKDTHGPLVDSTPNNYKMEHHHETNQSPGFLSHFSQIASSSSSFLTYKSK